MKKQNSLKDLYALIPLVFSGIICIGLTFVLWQKTQSSAEFVEKLSSFLGIFIGISGFIAFSILAYSLITVFGIQQLKSKASSNVDGLVLKMNNVREIVEILLNSKLWLPGVKECIDNEFEGLTFFEVKEFYKGNSKFAIEYLQEKRNYEDTESLYLELKSLLLIDPKQRKVPETVIFPESFKIQLLEKWLEHKVGSGLWYYFGYKFGSFKNALAVDAIFERHQDKIMSLANTIDSNLFEDSSFNEVFFSKLGEYINKDLIPKLHKQASSMKSSTPGMMRLLFALFAGTISIGVILPLLVILFQLPIVLLVFSFSFIISTLFFVLVTSYPFLYRNLH
jgi:hypothetical protein